MLPELRTTSMRYLVPYDFSAISKTALDHALSLSKIDNGNIELLHIIKDESKRVEAEVKFAELLRGIEEKEKVSTKVREGDIYKDIAKEASEGNFQLFVMGTHGAKGLQKLLGSHALKVITSSATPFIITQTKGPTESVNRIVLPVDLSNERIQIAKFASDIAQKFNAEIHIVSQPKSDEFLANKLKNNITKVKRKLKSTEVKYEVHTLKGEDSFYKEIIDYGRDHNADMFAISYYPETLLPQFEKFSQELITNDLEIPVLIVDAEELIGVKTNYSFIGI